MRSAAGWLAPLALGALLACQLRARPTSVLPALDTEGEVRVYLQPLPEGAPRLAFSLASVALARPGGPAVPLALILSEVSPPAGAAQRLLATGRVPPGAYDGLLVQIRRATLATEEGGVSDLLVPEEPVRVAAPVQVGRGRAVLVQLKLRPGQAPDHDFDFEGAFDARTPSPAAGAVQSSGYCTTPDLANLSVFDRIARQVTAVIATGREPRGIAVDPVALRAYVALAGEDQIQVLDLVTGEDLRRIPLRVGDEPTELALTPDGRTLLVTNSRSNTLAFVDVDAGVVTDRVSTGEEPAALLLEPAGRRAYLLDRRSGDLAAVDVGNRALVGRVPTEPEPVRAQLDRTGSRLYVIHRGSAYMATLSLPTLAQIGRVFVGLGASALKVDPRTDLIYVGHSDSDRIQVFDPGSLLPVDAIVVPGPVSYLGLDPVQNTLLALVPSRGQVAFVDLANRRMIATVDVAGEPYQVVVPGGRP